MIDSLHPTRVQQNEKLYYYKNLRKEKTFEPMIDTKHINNQYINEAFGSYEPDEDLVTREDSIFYV